MNNVNYYYRKDNVYLKIKNKTVIYYYQIDNIEDDKIESMMVISISNKFNESYT